MIRRMLATTLIMLCVFTIVGGVLYPLAITGLAQGIFRNKANGSILLQQDHYVGSELIGQSFTGPAYFNGRPSAAGSNGYDAAGSSGTNLGPTNKKLIEDIADRAQQVREENGLAPQSDLPADLVTTSASGLDPDISPAAAALQIDRIAAARNLSREVVQTLVEENTQGRELGIFGEPRVNVLKLNLALDQTSQK